MRRCHVALVPRSPGYMELTGAARESVAVALAFTSYAWLRALLLDANVQASHSENGAKGAPWIESF